MNIFLINGAPEEVIDNLFSVGDGGLINFGLTARSFEAAELGELEVSSVRFRDYLMEGGVTFRIQLRKLDQALQLIIKLEGTNRDQYIVPQIKFYVQQAGYKVAESSNA